MCFFLEMGDSPCSDWLPHDLMTMFPDVDVDQLLIFNDAVHDSSIVFMLDMPHLIKCIANAVERSSKKSLKQDLCYGKCLVNANAIKMSGLQWVGEHTSRHQPGCPWRILSKTHFLACAFSLPCSSSPNLFLT